MASCLVSCRWFRPAACHFPVEPPSLFHSTFCVVTDKECAPRVRRESGRAFSGGMALATRGNCQQLPRRGRARDTGRAGNGDGGCLVQSATAYADFLKSDFARVPLPRDRDLFADLIPLGTKLVALHLLDADALPDLLKEPKVRFASTGGEPRLGRFNKDVRRDPSGRVHLKDQNWLATVPEAAWEHWIGGYQPAQKWLKDRAQTGSRDKLKPSRLLTDEDILHYRRMLTALDETPKIVAEIDRVVETHGGWPDAFRGMKE